jgi:hypothetical protein
MTKARDIASAAPAPSTVSTTELGYLDGVTSAIQTQFANISGSKAQPTEPSSPTDGMIWVDTDGSTTDANFIPNTLMDAKGDIIAASAADTPAKLTVGSNNTVLTADSSTATGLKWATPATGALTLITSATFSGSSGQSLNDCFSATYRNYLIKATFDSTSAQTEIRARLRVSGSDNTSNNYRGAVLGTNSGMSGTTLTGDGTGTISYWQFNYLESTANDATSHMEIFNPYATAYTTFWNNAPRYRGSDTAIAYYMGSSTVTTSYTGLTIYPATGTMTGKVEVYGYAI